MRKLIMLVVAAFAYAVAVSAQVQFNHLDLSLTAGSTGVGFDLAMPVIDNVQIRTGATFMPTFHKKMNFPVEVGEPDPTLTPEQNIELSDARFDKLSSMLHDFMGLDVNNSVDMIGEPSLNCFKFLVDVFPLKNKHWHVTAGFYLGGRCVAKAYNTVEDMSTLIAVRSYNSMYEKALAQEPLVTYGDISIYNEEIYDRIRGYGRMTMHIGDYSHDIYATEDVYYDYTELDPVFLEPVVDANGREVVKGGLRFKKGEKMYSKGDPYRMVPDSKDCMVKTNAYANRFRPYLGIGYGGHIDKQKRTYVSFNAGAIFWGGVPQFITHDGIDLINDLTNVRSSIKHYLDIAKKFPVYPVVEIRVAQRLF